MKCLRSTNIHDNLISQVMLLGWTRRCQPGGMEARKTFRIILYQHPAQSEVPILFVRIIFAMYEIDYLIYL